MFFLKVFIFALVFIPVNSSAQHTFQKIYFFDDSIGVIDDLFPTDSCYYISGTIPSNSGSEIENFFGKLDLEGNLEYLTSNSDINSNQLSHFSLSELKQDVSGNFVSSFKNSGSNLGAPRVLRFSPIGIIESDTTYSDYVTLDSLYFFDGGRTVVNNYDSSTYFAYTYEDNSIGPNTNEIGVLLARYSQDGDLIWEKRISHPSSVQNKPIYLICGFTFTSDSTFIISIGEQKAYLSLQLEDQNNAQLHFFEFDSNGTELQHIVHQDGQYNIGRYALFRSEGRTIYSNFVSEYSPLYGFTQPTWRFSNAITCLDQSNSIIWKDTISPDDVSSLTYSSPNEFIASSDSSFSGAFSFYDLHYNQDSSSFKMEFQIELFNKLIETGDEIWKRHYHYFPEDSMRRVDYEIYDIERTNDDGYILGGYALSYDSLDAGRPAQYGYIIKTNCLGFLGDPQAAFSFSIDENTVQFNNESIMSGDFQWHFGDENSLSTDENELSVYHEYSESNIYTVQLIANGCNGASDTVNIDLDFEHMNGYAGDGTLLTLFPNPISIGESVSFYVGDIQDGTNKVQISDFSGKIIDTLEIESAQTTYSFIQNYASGNYLFSLISNDKIVEVEKLIVLQ